MGDVESLRAAELRLQDAQRSSDVAALDVLLHPDLTFIGPDGAFHDKAADLAGHRSGDMHLSRLDAHDLSVRVVDGVGITVLTAVLAGEFAGNAFDARMRYTRTWADDGTGWRIVAAQATVVADGSA